MNIEELKETVDCVAAQRRKLARMMENLPSMGAFYPPLEAYKNALAALSREECSIAFCGKVNCGKSTLLNAVIGRSILPVGDRPLSARVIEIENSDAESEGFTLLLTDGSEKKYTDLSMLERFAIEQGVEMTEIDGVKPEDILLIRLRCHMPNLPKGIRLVDTPGIGASYETHGRLSFRYLQKAHAVVYVLKSDAPVGQVDLPFLEAVVRGNKNIIFVQSCADAYEEERVVETAERNLELLVQLISADSEASDSETSENVRDKISYHVLAAECELTPPGSLMKKRRFRKYAGNFPVFMDSWRYMLSRTAGLDALEAAALCTHAYISANVEKMRERLAVAGQSAELGWKICLQAARDARLFREKWVGDTLAWKTLVEKLERAVMAAGPSMVQRLFALEQKLLARFDELAEANDKDSLKKLSADMSENINTEWLCEQESCVNRINRELQVLEWQLPDVRSKSVSRLLENGALVPLKLKNFGLGDVFRFFTVFVAAISQNWGAAIWRGWRFFSAIQDKENENSRVIQEAREKLQDSFSKIRTNFMQVMEAKDNPMATLFKMAVAQAYDSIMRQYESLVQNAGDQLQTFGRSDEEKQKIILLLEGTPEKAGLLSLWSRSLNLVTERLQELQQYRAG